MANDYQERFQLTVIGYAFLMLGIVLEILVIITTLLGEEAITDPLMFGAALVISGMILVLDSLRGMMKSEDEEDD